MHFIETNSKHTSGLPIKLAYTDHGSGKPVILIHGWPLCKEMWEYQCAALIDSGMRVISYDRRGFGSSCKPWSGYDYDTLANDLKAVIDQLKLEDVTLVGFSMGGGEIVRYFSKHGGTKVSKVILISSVTPYLLKTEDNPDGVPRDALNDMRDGVLKDRIAFLDDFGKAFFGVNMVNKPVSTPLLEYFRMLGSMGASHATLECLKSFGTTDFRREMKSVNVPTLIIHGDADKTVPINAAGKQSAASIPMNQFLTYEGAPHGLFYTEKDRLNKDLVSFITKGQTTLQDK
jgi:pimeloyl-ACP methyl ester carboxylesterase